MTFRENQQPVHQTFDELDLCFHMVNVVKHSQFGQVKAT